MATLDKPTDGPLPSAPTRQYPLILIGVFQEYRTAFFGGRFLKGWRCRGVSQAMEPKPSTSVLIALIRRARGLA